MNNSELVTLQPGTSIAVEYYDGMSIHRMN